MAYNTLSFDTRLSENIKNYTLTTLYDEQRIFDFLRHLARKLNVELMLTARHGEKELVVGDFSHFEIDVVNRPGIKIRVQNRTIAHLYVKSGASEDIPEDARELIDDAVAFLEYLGEQSYGFRETSIYVDELERNIMPTGERRSNLEKEDPLTGVFNAVYFEKRSSILDRSETAPIAVIEVNINDWKVHNDRLGDEGSDRLIKTVAGILKDQAKPEYVIGRIDGDVFAVLIPMPGDGEAEDYVNLIRNACDTYEDPYITPSVAVGLAYKENVEESIKDKLSDAEYLCLEDKLAVKNSDVYKARMYA